MILASNFDAKHTDSLVRTAVPGGVDYQFAQDQTQALGLNCRHETPIGDGRVATFSQAVCEARA
ncbi:MAG: hypothetical protein QOJ15_11446 [Bradyrhizobium sp.]|nr:hypothetical protein [Bradyrhizobium sp.]